MASKHRSEFVAFWVTGISTISKWHRLFHWQVSRDSTFHPRRCAIWDEDGMVKWWQAVNILMLWLSENYQINHVSIFAMNLSLSFTKNTRVFRSQKRCQTAGGWCLECRPCWCNRSGQGFAALGGELNCRSVLLKDCRPCTSILTSINYLIYLSCIYIYICVFFPKQLWSWMGFSILPRNRLCSIIISCFRLGFRGLSPYSFGILFHHHFLVPARVPGLVSLLFWYPVPSSFPGSG